MGTVEAIAELLSRVFGWAVDPNGLARMTLDQQLRIIRRGIDEALATGDMESADLLFGWYRELLARQT